MHKPVVYRICIEGELSESWSEYFCAQSLSVESGSEGQVTTIIVTGPMDQGALVGLINYLNGLGISLISVEPNDTE